MYRQEEDDGRHDTFSKVPSIVRLRSTCTKGTDFRESAAGMISKDIYRRDMDGQKAQHQVCACVCVYTHTYILHCTQLYIHILHAYTAM